MIKKWRFAVFCSCIWFSLPTAFTAVLTGCAQGTDTPENHAPVADAGPDQTVNAGTAVSLNGGGSSDADGDPLTYAWSFSSKPEGAQAVLSASGEASPTFTADQVGVYTLTLVVNDGTADSAADAVTITAASPFAGATLLATIDTGFPLVGNAGSPNFNHGMTVYDNEFYLVSWSSRQLTKISPATGSIVQGYPKSLNVSDFIGGVAVDPSDGSIWVCEINNAVLRHYSAAVSHLGSVTLLNASGTGMTGDVIVYDGKAYAVRASGKIAEVYVVDLLNTTLQSKFTLTEVNYLEGPFGWRDISVSNGALYIACGLFHDGLPCIVKTNPDGSNQVRITVDDSSVASVGFTGVYASNDELYITAQHRMLVTDMSGKVLNRWEFDAPPGFNGIYERAEIVQGRIYVASSNGGTSDTKGPHLLVYDDNRDSP